VVVFYGEPGANRTRDQLIKSPYNAYLQAIDKTTTYKL